MDKKMSSLCGVKKYNIRIDILIRKLMSSVKSRLFTCEYVVCSHPMVKYHMVLVWR